MICGVFEVEFQKWFTNNFPEIYEACLYDDYVARQYRKVIKKTFDMQQKKIDDIQSKLNKIHYSADQQSKIPMTDEFNRGWVSAWTCVKEGLKKCK